MNNTEKSFKNLSEIIELSEDDIKNNNKNVTAILDLDDIKSLQTMLQEFNKLEQDNYRLDRENQLLFEKEINFRKKIEEELNKRRNAVKPYDEYNKESRQYWIDTGIINYCKELLEDK